MSGFKNREKRQALLFITLGVIVSIFSYQNFQYPTIRKSNVDLSSGLNTSDREIQGTREKLKPDELSLDDPKPVSRTQVIESPAPMQLKLKRAPAKTRSVKKKKATKAKTKKKIKKKKTPKKKSIKKRSA